MDSNPDFEAMFRILDQHQVRYLVIGGLAVIYHAKPRYTKDLDLWVDPDPENIQRANAALEEFGSPFLLDAAKADEIIQIGLPPNRIDLLLEPGGVSFAEAWDKRIRDRFGSTPTNWIDVDSLIRIKSRIDDPRHREDVRVLMEVKKRRAGK
jgi:hypothetical protein